MKHSPLIAALSLTLLVNAYNPFKGATKSYGKDQVEMIASPEFNPYKLLDSKSRKPELYNKAMLELKRLEEEPICHRVAVQLLMDNCQGLEEGADGEYQLQGAHLQRHHVESFAASLAICDLERGRFVIPHACTPFTSLALLRASRDVKGQLEVSPEQVGGCLEALGQNPSLWSTWLSYRDKALLFCRASRLDVDKDQAILQHRKLTQIMAEFTSGLDDDLEKIKENMAEHARSTDSYFEGVKAHADHIKAKFQHSMEAISSDFKDTASLVKSSLGSITDLQSVLRNLVDIVIQGSAKMAAEQENAISLSTQGTKSQLETLNNLAGETGASVVELREAILLLFPVIQSLSERQDSIDQRSEALSAALVGMTDLLNNHTEHLEEATCSVFKIQHTLENAAASAKLWNDTLNFGNSQSDWILRIGGPVATLVLGNYGLSPSLNQNVRLLTGGYASAETLIQLRRMQWDWECCSWPTWHWSFKTSAARSFAQQAKPVPVATPAGDEPTLDERHTGMV